MEQVRTNSGNQPKPGSWRWQTGTLKSYALLLVAILVSVILGLNIFSFIQNTRQLEISRGVSEVRMPLGLRAQDLLIGLNQVSTVQRGFLLTSDQAFIEERKEIWDDRIWPALEVLREMKPSLKIKENVQRIDKLEELLPKYEKLQEEIDQQQLAFTAVEEVPVNEAMDSLALLNIVEQLRQNTEDRRLISGSINQKVVPLQQEIRQAINPLIETQEHVLKTNIQEVVEGIETSRIVFLVFSLLGISIAGILALFFIKKLKSSIKKPKTLLEQLSQGVLVEEVEETKDELNDVLQAGKRLNKNLAAASAFAKSIGEGDFKTNFAPASEQDTLGNALVQMRDRLLEVAEEDKRRNWTTSGLAQIGEILRKEHQETAQLYLNIIRFVVTYLNANQGGLFLVNDEDADNRTLELVSCYAYERQKYLQKTIMPGEGLIGQAYLEQKPIFLTEVPDAYVQITSGLGNANPRCLLISPLKVNDEVSGIIEIACFKVLEDYEVEFVTKLSETIASAISSVKVNERTSMLLEETQQQAEEMRAQEEEMRQNNEELQATQEEMRRKGLEAEEHNVRLNAVLGATVDAIVTIDERGIIETVNTACEKLFDYSSEELIGSNIKILMSQEHADRHDGYLDKYHQTGERKIIGKSRELMGKRKDGSAFPLSLAVNEVIVADKKIFTGIMRDISEQKDLEDQLKQQLEEAKASEEELRQNMEELNSIQEALAAKNEEVEKIRAVEKERAEKQIAAQTKIMEKAMGKFKLREKELLDQLAQKNT